MAERSSTFDTFKQHTYVPNKLYSVLNLARAAILGDLAAEIQTAAPGHSAAAINEAIKTAGEFRWTLEVALVDGTGHVLDGFDDNLAINLAATVASGHGVATFGDGDLAHPSAREAIDQTETGDFDFRQFRHARNYRSVAGPANAAA